MNMRECDECDKIGFNLDEDPCEKCSFFHSLEHITISSNADCQLEDVVNSPSHYKVGGIETIDFIEAKGFNFNLANTVKYISRAGHKLDMLEDLKKAQWYLTREITKLSGKRQ